MLKTAVYAIKNWIFLNNEKSFFKKDPIDGAGIRNKKQIYAKPAFNKTP